jgi:tetratricopeptide (TPR) repeat protein
MQGRFDEALSLSSLSMKKLEPWANFHLGYLYKYRVSVFVRVGRFSEAIQNCKTAIALFESDEQLEWALPLRNQCGEMLFKTECFMEATKIVAPITFGKNKDCQIVVRGIALSVAGKSEFEMGNLQGAIDLLQESIKILKPLEHSELGTSACYLAKALQVQNRLNEAQSLIERVLQLELQPAAKVELQNHLDVLLEKESKGFAGVPEKAIKLPNLLKNSLP